MKFSFSPRAVLGSITPAGIILLNVAVTVAPPQEAALPMSLAPVAFRLGLPFGPVYWAAAAVILFLPSLLALYLLWRGPPGSPFLRFGLGMWLCWTAITTLAGPGAEVFSGLANLASPGRWLLSLLGAPIALRLLVLVWMFVGTIAGDDVGREVIAAVRVDDTRPWVAAAGGAVFAVAGLLLNQTNLAGAIRVELLVGAALGIGWLLDRGGAAAPSGDARSTGEMARAWSTGAVHVVGWTALVVLLMGVAPAHRWPKADELLPLPAWEFALPKNTRIEQMAARFEREGIPYRLRWHPTDPTYLVPQEFRARAIERGIRAPMIN